MEHIEQDNVSYCKKNSYSFAMRKDSNHVLKIITNSYLLIIYLEGIK